MSQVIVVIDPRDGTSTFEVNGVQGSKCEEITEALTRDNEVLEHQLTEEYEVPEELPDFIHNPGDEE